MSELLDSSRNIKGSSREGFLAEHLALVNICWPFWGHRYFAHRSLYTHTCISIFVPAVRGGCPCTGCRSEPTPGGQWQPHGAAGGGVGMGREEKKWELAVQHLLLTEPLQHSAEAEPWHILPRQVCWKAVTFEEGWGLIWWKRALLETYRSADRWGAGLGSQRGVPEGFWVEFGLLRRRRVCHSSLLCKAGKGSVLRQGTEPIRAGDVGNGSRGEPPPALTEVLCSQGLNAQPWLSLPIALQALQEDFSHVIFSIYPSKIRSCGLIHSKRVFSEQNGTKPWTAVELTGSPYHGQSHSFPHSLWHAMRQNCPRLPVRTVHSSFKW